MTLTGLVTIFAMGSMSIEAVTVSAFARARRRGILYLFASVCVLGATYAAVALLLQLDLPARAVPWVVQLGYLSTAAYTGVLLHFLSTYEGLRLALWEHLLGRVGTTVICALAIVPGVLFEPESAVAFEVADTTFLQPTPTPVAFVAFAALAGALLALVHVGFRLRNQLVRGWPILASLALLAILSASDMATTLQLVRLPYLAQVAGVAICVAMAWQLASEWGEEARQLVDLRRGLEQGIGKRSAELSAAREALAHQDRMTIMGRVAASVGHEINNPLTFVLGNLEMLRESIDDPDDRELLEQALEGGWRIASIVQDLRVFAKRSTSSVRSVRLDKAVQTAGRTLGRRLTERRRLEVEVPDDIWVSADPAGLTQVFVNLVANALDAMEGSTSDHRIVIRAEGRSADIVVVSVADDGPGLDDSVRDRLFEPFQGASRGGLGLGLTIVRDLVESFGGRVEVATHDTPGTTFVLTLPRTEVAPTEPRGDAKDRLKGLRVLVVDDQPEIARTLTRLLQPATVGHALSGFSALEQLADTTYDLVLCDVMMPGMSGLGLLELLRERDLRPQGFVLMTGGATDRALQEALERSGVPLLYKPFGRREVVRWVDAMGLGQSP